MPEAHQLVWQYHLQQLQVQMHQPFVRHPLPRLKSLFILPPLPHHILRFNLILFPLSIQVSWLLLNLSPFPHSVLVCSTIWFDKLHRQPSRNTDGRSIFAVCWSEFDRWEVKHCYHWWYFHIVWVFNFDLPITTDIKDSFSLKQHKYGSIVL